MLSQGRKRAHWRKSQDRLGPEAWKRGLWLSLYRPLQMTCLTAETVVMAPSRQWGSRKSATVFHLERAPWTRRASGPRPCGTDFMQTRRADPGLFHTALSPIPVRWSKKKNSWCRSLATSGGAGSTSLVHFSLKPCWRSQGSV